MENEFKKLITVVIPAYNEEKNISKCIMSVICQKMPIEKIEIIVVDNGSTDNTAYISNKILTEYKCGKVLYKKGGTIASVRNYGARISSGKVLAFLDADSVADPEWLTFGLEILSSDEAISCVGFAVAPPSAESSWIQRTWYLISSSGKRKGTVDVDWLSSFNLVLRKNMFEKIGGFDESLKTCEDAELGLRLSEISRLIFSDKCSVRHLGAVSCLSEFVKKELWRGQNALDTFWKSPKSMKRFLSIAVPTVYFFNFFVMLILLLLMIVKSNYFIFFGFCFSVFLALPLFMSFRAGVGFNSNLFYTTILHVFYLLARGVAVVKYSK